MTAPGEVFTRRWIVDLILDLAGYTSDRDLASLVAIEPACGTGAFLGPMVSRLSASCRAHGRDLAEASDAIRAFDVLAQHVETSRQLVSRTLVEDGWKPSRMPTTWVTQSDYLLLQRQEGVADFVLGNPPYIRIEDLPEHLMAAYREACHCMVGRSDVYVGFFEVALLSLKPGGVVGFICADRWMRNHYGSRLRAFISGGFSVDTTILLHDVDAFETPVAAYPAISLIRKTSQGAAILADTRRAFGPSDAATVISFAGNPTAAPSTDARLDIGRLPKWFTGPASWPTGSPARLAVIEELNGRFRPLEDKETGTRVGIGVATGADRVFVTSDADIVEPDRLLPLAMVRDTKTGKLTWHGSHLVNPWCPKGSLVDLAAYPRLHSYFQTHSSALRGRYVARSGHWYRTIDKIDDTLASRPKLLFPDMRVTIHPVLDEGGLYPHHNLYYIVSDTWDLRVLGGLLLSQVAQAFVEAYAVRMRGGTLRFQAQYLRRIRVPHPSQISAADQAALSDAFTHRDRDAATEIASRLYRIGPNLAGFTVSQ